jgi:hypothetical protein
MATKTAGASKPQRRKAAPKAAATKRTNGAKRRPNWKRLLEQNLILEGYSKAEAKELVALSAK